MTPDRICTQPEAAALLEALKLEWGKLRESDRLDCRYVLAGAHEREDAK